MPGTAAAKDGRHGQTRTTIAQARALPLGTVVTIEGTVTTPSGVFASSYDDQGFAIQDRTAGIFVSFPDTNIGVRPSRHVEVTGALQESPGLRVVTQAVLNATLCLTLCPTCASSGRPPQIMLSTAERLVAAHSAHLSRPS